MPVQTNVTFRYVCDKCGFVYTVAYEIREGNDYPKAFVSSYNVKDYLIGQGSAFVKLIPSGKILCVSCKSGA